MFIQNFLQTYKWLLLASFFSALTILVIKYYEKNSNNLLLLIAALSETGLIYSYIQLLKKDDILTKFSLVKIIAILIVIIPSMLFFGTELTTSKIFGLLFGIASIYLLK